jgi:DNA-binding LytR/AlgR family response regulator
MTTALIADDEPLMRANLREHLQSLWPELQIVAEAADGAEALRSLVALKPDLAFLDIQMPGLSGLQVARLVDDGTQVVFVTAFDRHALEAFEAQAVDYLLKPVDEVRLARVVTRLKRRDETRPSSTQIERMLARLQPEPLPAALDWLQVDVGRQIRMIHIDDVQFFESDSKYTRVVTVDCDGVIRLSLKELLASLDVRTWQQIHRSVVVNRRFVHSVHRRGEAMEIEIRGREQRLKVSESNQHLFRGM